MDVTYAHTRANCAPETWERLEDHLAKTSARCRMFCDSFAPMAGALAGRWHDLGKYRQEFQKYLKRTPEAGYQEAHGHVQHSIVGAYQACEAELDHLALAIYGHHGRLPALPRRPHGYA